MGSQKQSLNSWSSVLALLFTRKPQGGGGKRQGRNQNHRVGGKQQDGSQNHRVEVGNNKVGAKTTGRSALPFWPSKNPLHNFPTSALSMVTGCWKLMISGVMCFFSFVASHALDASSSWWPLNSSETQMVLWQRITVDLCEASHWNDHTQVLKQGF